MEPDTYKKQAGHLPFFGVGPLYVAVIAVATAAGLWAARRGWLASGSVPALRLPFTVLGAALILGGAALWRAAVLRDKIDAKIAQNQLATDGAYAWVRNPVYSAFLLAFTGALLLAANLWLLLLPPLFWLLLTIFVRCTEEKWLRRQYGEEYLDYYKRVGRCIPRPPRKG